MNGPIHIGADPRISTYDAVTEPVLTVAESVVVLAGRISSAPEISAMLAAQGTVTEFVSNGDALLQHISLNPDLILMDAALWETDLCRSLQTQTFEIPVILLAEQLPTPRDKLRMLQSGCVDYLLMPQQADEIVARVNIHLALRTRQRRLQQQVEQLHESQDALQKQVKLRTAALSRNNSHLRKEIGDRVHIETALRAREEQFRSLAENASDIIVRYDAACRLIYANPAYLRLSGYSEAEVLGKTPSELHCFGETSHAYQAVLEKVLATGINAETLFEGAPSGNRQIFYQVRVAAEYDRQGKVMSVLAIGRNVTALKEAEKYLQESRAELRELTMHREAMREEERKQIARELHDELGQLLTTLRMRTRLLQPEFIGSDQALLRERSASMLEIIDHAVEVVRNVVSNLRPGILDLDISSALQWLGHEFTRDHGIPCDVDVPGTKFKLDDERSVALFRIAQESLTNIVKHAAASRVSMRLRKHSGKLLLEIQDNGKGFDPAGSGKKKSYGILGIKERAQMLNGKVSINSSVGNGALIRVEAPLGTEQKQQGKAK